MTRSNRHSKTAVVAGLGAAWLLAMVLACSTGASSVSPSESASATANERVLTDVRVERSGSGTVVTLIGVGKPEYRAFEQTNPRRLVVELLGVRPDRMAERVAIREGGVSEIGVTAVNGATRVELALTPGADAEVVPRGDRLEVRVRRSVPSSSAAASVDSGPPHVSAGPTGSETDLSNLPASNDAEAAPAAPASDAAPAAPKAEPAPAASAAGGRRLTGVEPMPSPEGTIVLLRGDGRIDGAQSFVLQHPDRLVLDLAGVKNATPKSRIDVNSPEVSRVRVAQHEGKVRVVVDGGSKESPFAVKHLVSSEQGLVVAVGTSEQVATQAAGAGATQIATSSEPKAAPAAAPAPATPAPSAPAASTQTAESAPAPASSETTETAALPRVTNVRFETDENEDRVIVESSGPVQGGALLRPDAETVVLRFLGATLDPQAATKIVPEKAGSISTVTAFEQPPGKRQKKPEVRVVVRRAPGVEPKVTRAPGMATFTFAKGAAIAQKPPMLGGGETAAQGGSLGAKAAAAAAPAAMDGSGSSEILQEGGLVGGKEYSGRRISLDLREVEIDDVLRLVAEVSDLNVIAGDDVAGKVTIRLVDVPWDQALDVILLTKGLGFVRVGNVLRIAPTTLLQQEEEARLQERRAKEKLADLAVKLQPVNYANVKEVEKMVKRLLTPRGVVNIDERTSTLIIKDIPQVIDEATALVKAIDTQTPQVMIEAKIVEANLDFSREIGAVWGMGTNPFNDGFDNDSGQKRNMGSPDFRLHDNRNFLPGSSGLNNVAVANPITSLANGLLNVGAFLLDERFNVELQLQAAESNGEGKVISSPRIVTLDNREAKIEQGVSIPFQTFENGDAQLEFIDAVLSLLVTPHITADKSIIMKVEVTRNAPDDSVQTPTGSPAIAKNQAKTETLVKDGQTLVIGGIYVVQKGDRSSRVPYVHKIPILGNAFKNIELRDIRKELLIFVTPRIVENGQDIAAQ
jgi:type IV pilus assembly protein PilQ